MIYYFIIEKTIFDNAIFAFNTVNDYTLQKSDFNKEFVKNEKTYVACICDEAYITDSLFEKVAPENLQNWLCPDVTEISPRQFDLQLIDEGLYEQVIFMIDQSPLEVKVWYNRSTVIKIDNPILNEFASMLNKDIVYLKSFFKKASLK